MRGVWERTGNEDEAMRHEWEREREGKNSTVEESCAVCVRACEREVKSRNGRVSERERASERASE